MTIAVTARASANSTETRSTSFGAVSQALPSKVVLMLQYTATVGVTENELSLLTSPDDAGNRFGYGSPIHRAAIRQWAVHEGAIPVYALPIADPAGAAAAAGVVDFTGSVPTESGTIAVYVAGDRYALSVTTSSTATTLGDALVSALAADANAVVTGVNTAGSVALTAKWEGLATDGIDLSVNLAVGESNPAGSAVAITAMTGGAGDESTVLQDAWDAIMNSTLWITDVVSPSGTTAVQDVNLTNIGTPNDTPTGLYNGLDYRPATAWTAGVEPGSTGFNNAVAVGLARTTDAANDWVQAPDYPELPFEIASAVCAIVAQRANSNAASHYEGLSLLGFFGPKDPANDWTSGKDSYGSRDTAVKSGLSLVKTVPSGIVLGDITSFYNPASLVNAAMKLEVNKRKVWNVAYDLKNDKASPDRQGQVIVQSAEAATNQAKATDTDIEGARVVSLADQWESRGLIFNSKFTKQNLVVEINDQNPDRIDRAVPVVLSGNARIRDDLVLADRNIAISNDLVTIVIGG